MSNLLSLSYWFSLSPAELMPLVKTMLLAGFAAMVVIGVALRRLAARKSGSLAWVEGGRRFGRLGVTMGILGLLLVFFTHELVYFFGARFWYLIWLLATLVWIGLIVRTLVRDVPRRAAAYAERARIEKWLPKGK